MDSNSDLNLNCRYCGENWSYGWDSFLQLLDFFIIKKKRAERNIKVQCVGCGMLLDIEDVCSFMAKRCLGK